MKLIKSEFRAWLEENRDNTVGKGKHVCKCPIATYIESLGAYDVVVDGISVQSRTFNCELRPWAVSFIGEIDCYFGYASITGAEALEHL